MRLTETRTVWAVDAVTTGTNGDGLTEEKTGWGWVRGAFRGWIVIDEASNGDEEKVYEQTSYKR